jgi:predicted permease
VPTLRYAWRSLSRSKGFVAVAILALGLGLGLSTTMFAVLDAALNPYVAYRDPQALYSINWWFGRRSPMTPPELYRYVRDNTHSFEGVVPVALWGQAALTSNGATSQVGVKRVTPRWFALVGVTPRLGRAFTDADGEDVVMLGPDIFRRLFGLRRNLAGTTVMLDGRLHTVVGVMPRGTGGADVVLPLPPTVETSSVTASYIRPYVRLRHGVSLEHAQAELKRLATLLTDRYGQREAPFALELNPVVDRREELKDIHKAMVGSALAVLLIACVNLAHLMLARGLAKRRELALRMALGAPRGTVIRQMFAEAAIVTLGGSAFGALVTIWGADFLRNRMPREVQWIGLVQPQLSWRVFALAAGTAALSAMLFGLVPAMRVAFSLSLDEPMKDDSGTTTARTKGRFNPLVIAEVAVALVLMMGGGLLLRTVHQLTEERPDYDVRTLWQAWLSPKRTGDTTVATFPSRDAVSATVLATPGVRDLAFVSYKTPAGMVVSAELTADSNRTITMRSYPTVSSSYLKVRGLPILRGRDFEPGDAAGAGVAILDALAAQQLYPGQDAVGHMVKLGGPVNPAPWIPIVGVVRSPRDLEGEGRYAPQPHVFVSMGGSQAGGSMLIRTLTDDRRTAATIMRRLQDLPGVGGGGVWPFDYQRQSDIISRTFLAKMFVGMGAVALGLAALGLYGVLAYAVTRRMREFAVRIALGAEPRRLLKMVLYDGFVMLLAGIGIGAFAALMASRWLDSVLIAVLPSDVVTLVMSEAVLITAGVAAALVPARRASRANPLDILRAT